MGIEFAMIRSVSIMRQPPWKVMFWRHKRQHGMVVEILLKDPQLEVSLRIQLLLRKSVMLGKSIQVARKNPSKQILLVEFRLLVLTMYRSELRPNNTRTNRRYQRSLLIEIQ
jgi:hypothetical protein